MTPRARPGGSVTAFEQPELLAEEPGMFARLLR